MLAYLRDEPGGDVVKSAFSAETTCSAANWSETMQKVLQHGDDWALASQLLKAQGVTIEPVTQADAEWAAVHWTSHPNLSLGDRLCLALANRLGTTALTADTAWDTDEGIRHIR